MRRDTETGLPLHPTVDLEKAKRWQAPVGWTALDRDWLASKKPHKLEPIFLTQKNKHHDNQLYSTLGSFALYRSDFDSVTNTKKHIMKRIHMSGLRTIKPCVHINGKWYLVKILCIDDWDKVSIGFIKNEAYFNNLLGRLAGFYARNCENGSTKYYLMQEWIEGETFNVAINWIKEKSLLDRLKEAKSILQTFIELNSMGIQHGEPHEENIIRRPDGVYMLIDFENTKLLNKNEPDESMYIDRVYFNKLFSRAEIDALINKINELISESYEERERNELNPSELLKAYREGVDAIICEENKKILQQGGFTPVNAG